MKIRKLEQKKTKKNENKKTAMYEYQKESQRGTSNLLDETIYLIEVFEIDVFFALLKEKLPNNKIQNHLDLKYCGCSEFCS